MIPANNNDRRVSVRRKVFLGGQVIIGADNPRPFDISPCIIKDLTKDGARIQVPSGANLPETISLEIPMKHCKFKARLVWRSGDFAGICFDGFDQGTAQTIPYEPMMINDKWSQ